MAAPVTEPGIHIKFFLFICFKHNKHTMKSLTTILFAALVFSSCNQHKSDPHLAAIEKNITANAMGIDIGYQPGKLDTVLLLTNQAAVKDLCTELGKDISTDWPSAIEGYTK